MIGARTNIGEALKHLVLILGAIVVILPFYIMVSYSLKSPSEIERNVGGFMGAQAPMVDERCVKRQEPNRQSVIAAQRKFPGVSERDVRDKLMVELREQCSMLPVVFNYSKAFSEAPLLRYLLNGVFVTLTIFFIQVLVALPCAYALAKLRFWGRDVVFGLVLFCLLIPVHAIALPLYIMLSRGRANQYLRSFDHSVDYLCLWYLPDAPVLHDGT